MVTSSVSKAFPIADAGFGAVAYVLDILTGAIGDQRRWRTMPWLVLLFGLLIVPLGIVSVGFIVIQPTIISALRTLPRAGGDHGSYDPYSVDEVFATAHLWRSKRANRSLWRTLIFGGPVLRGARSRTGPEDADQQDPPGVSQRRRDLSLDADRMHTDRRLPALHTPCLGRRAAALLQRPHRGLPRDRHLGHGLGRGGTACSPPERPTRIVDRGIAIPGLDGGTTVALMADVAAGLALAALSLPRGTRSREHYGGWDRYIL